LAAARRSACILLQESVLVRMRVEKRMSFWRTSTSIMSRGNSPCALPRTRATD
jgi:hypothetical protein